MVEKDRKHINSGDAALFKDLIGETRPVKSRPRTISKPAPSTRPTPKQPRGPIGHNAASFMPEAPTAGADEQLSYRRDGVSERRMRDLRRGRIAIQADLDLHGMTTAEAYPVLCDFLADCAVNPVPTAEQLAEIARSAAKVARDFDVTPRVGMISYSNFGSAPNRTGNAPDKPPIS